MFKNIFIFVVHVIQYRHAGWMTDWLNYNVFSYNVYLIYAFRSPKKRDCPTVVKGESNQEGDSVARNKGRGDGGGGGR
jgi:hypothetical protein